MQIFWKGQSCFHILVSERGQEQLKIAIDPFGESLGLRLSPLEADLALFTHDHEDHSNIRAIKANPFLIANPGEYEVRNVYIRGVASFHDDAQGKEQGLNTIYVIEAEDLKLCHLGDLGQKELSSEQLDAIGPVDILFIPTGGGSTIDGKEAGAIIKEIEPRIALPMHYALPKIKMKLADVQDFLKAMGAKSVQSQEKLTVKAKDLTGEETKIVLLQP